MSVLGWGGWQGVGSGGGPRALLDGQGGAGSSHCVPRGVLGARDPTRVPAPALSWCGPCACSPVWPLAMPPGRAGGQGRPAVPHCSPLFCFAPPPHGLLSSSWACMQSVSEPAALLVRPERALPPPACINSLSWPGRFLANPLPTVGGSWHTGGGGRRRPGSWWLPGQASGVGGVHLYVASPGPALQGWGWVTWLLSPQTPMGS